MKQKVAHEKKAGEESFLSFLLTALIEWMSSILLMDVSEKKKIVLYPTVSRMIID